MLHLIIYNKTFINPRFSLSTNFRDNNTTFFKKTGSEKTENIKLDF